VAVTPRIEELRRRVATDPASIAFAQLAEEYRRTGDYEEAVRVCRAGLAQHPNCLSARVTLGRALLELQQFDDAKAELEIVVAAGPDNLAAIRALAEMHQRRGEVDDAPKQIGADDPAAPVAPLPAAPPPDYTRVLAAVDSITLDHPMPTTVEPADPALGELEAWLEAIVRDRKAHS
jgi:tetratricopeptide (TPR) repeat protein